MRQDRGGNSLAVGLEELFHQPEVLRLVLDVVPGVAEKEAIH
jgi:hypothetical protein